MKRNVWYFQKQNVNKKTNVKDNLKKDQLEYCFFQNKFFACQKFDTNFYTNKRNNKHQKLLKQIHLHNFFHEFYLNIEFLLKKEIIFFNKKLY